MLLTERAQIVSTGNVSQRTCPRCQSARVFRRHRLARWQNWLSRMNYYPYRCHACGYRFITKSRSAAQEEVRPEVRKQRIRRMIGDVVIGAIVWRFFCYSSISSPAPPQTMTILVPCLAVCRRKKPWCLFGLGRDSQATAD